MLPKFHSAMAKEVNGEKINMKDAKFLMLTIPAFMCYACGFNLQSYLKSALNVAPSTFSVAYAFLYMGNLLFRFFHNYFWIFTKPFYRIVISYFFFALSLCFMILAQAIQWDKTKDNSWLAFLVYACAGIGIGTLESNVLNVASLVSHGARYFAVMGIPIGVNLITIFSFLIIGAMEGVMTAGQVCILFFSIVIAGLAVATFILFKYIPHGSFFAYKDEKKYQKIEDENNEDATPSEAQRDSAAAANDLTTSIHYLPQAFKNFRQWLPQVLPNAISMCCNMFTVSQFAPGIVLYTINNSRDVKAFGITMKADYYRVIFGVFTFLGDFCSRLIFEKVKYVFPPLFLYMNLAGVLMVISGVPEVMILGNFLVMFSNGIIYVQTSRWVKESTAGTSWNLAAYSFWLFVGDSGSVVASFSQQALVQGICVDLRNKIKPFGWDPCPYYDPK